MRYAVTNQIFSTDSYARSMDAAVVGVDPDDRRVLLDQTVFYPGGGGQPHDIGSLWVGEEELPVVRVASDSDGVWQDRKSVV